MNNNIKEPLISTDDCGGQDDESCRVNSHPKNKKNNKKSNKSSNSGFLNIFSCCLKEENELED